jgi:hypothetical protein
MRGSVLGLILAGLLAPGACAAPPALTYLFPAGAQRGQTVAVMAGGTFERWPVRGWADVRGITVKGEKDRGKLSVSVAADVPPGTHWLRVHDEQGASALRPFVVGVLPEVVEQEPNDDPKKPQVLPSSTVTINGRLSQRGDVDGFAVRLRKGQTLVASVEANRTLGSPMDAVLQVLSDGGFVLAENNDYHDLDPQIAFVAPADGQYIVRTFAFPANPDSTIGFASGETFVYRLTLTTGGFAEYAWPLAVAREKSATVELRGWNIPEAAKKVTVEGEGETAVVFHPQAAGVVSVRREGHAAIVEVEPNDPRHPQEISLPVTVSGRIARDGDVDAYQFRAKKGQQLVFRVESRVLGFPLDAVLRLTDAAGKVLGQVDDTGNAADPELSFTVPQDGTYRLEIRDLHGEGGERHVYRLRALIPEPDFDLAVASDRFTLTPGKAVDVPVTVARRQGFAQPVEVRAEGLPEGVTAAAVQSPGSGAAAKTVTLRLTASKGPVSGAFRIVGRASDKWKREAHFTLAGPSGSTPYLWLTVTPSGPAGGPPVGKPGKPST